MSNLSQQATEAIRLWIATGDDDDGTGNGFAVQRYGRSEVMAQARAADSDDDAAALLRSWFLDRLTVDPGVPGPFGSLAFDLLSAVLDEVDWSAVVADLDDLDPMKPGALAEAMAKIFELAKTRNIEVPSLTPARTLGDSLRTLNAFWLASTTDEGFARVWDRDRSAAELGILPALIRLGGGAYCLESDTGDPSDVSPFIIARVQPDGSIRLVSGSHGDCAGLSRADDFDQFGDQL